LKSSLRFEEVDTVATSPNDSVTTPIFGMDLGRLATENSDVRLRDAVGVAGMRREETAAAGVRDH
jgi:hypothetical protein